MMLTLLLINLTILKCFLTVKCPVEHSLELCILTRKFSTLPLLNRPTLRTTNLITELSSPASIITQNSPHRSSHHRPRRMLNRRRIKRLLTLIPLNYCILEPHHPPITDEDARTPLLHIITYRPTSDPPTAPRGLLMSVS